MRHTQPPRLYRQLVYQALVIQLDSRRGSTGDGHDTIAKGNMGRVGALTGEGGAEQSMPTPFPAFPA